MAIGQLYGIGAGTGDPELITLKGWRILRSVPVVAFPAGLNGKSGMAQKIVEEWLQPEQKQLALDFPFVRDEGALRQAWAGVADEVWSYLEQGQDVAFVSEGDVSFYSTFTYLAETLQEAHPEVTIATIPGISSPMAASAVLGLPLTVRSQRLMILPAIYAVADLETALSTADVVVLMKVASVYEQVWQVLQQRGLLESSYVVERATLPDQKVYKGLSDRPSLHLSYFSILIVQINEGEF